MITAQHQKMKRNESMRKSGATDYKVVTGWFESTLSSFRPSEPIALLRLDCDLYDSTAVCLAQLASHVAAGGLLIIDDYEAWDGCTCAVNQHLAQANGDHHLPRLRQFENDLYYIRF